MLFLIYSVYFKRQLLFICSCFPIGKLLIISHLLFIITGVIVVATVVIIIFIIVISFSFFFN